MMVGKVLGWLLLIVFCAAVLYVIFMDTYAAWVYSDDCEWYGYDHAGYNLHDGVYCEKKVSLQFLNSLHDDWDSRAK